MLGIYIRDTEGAGEWGRVLLDLQKRGVEDVLFFCVDGLAGFSEAILEVFPSPSCSAASSTWCAAARGSSRTRT